jgi:hypothetical protein
MAAVLTTGLILYGLYQAKESMDAQEDAAKAQKEANKVSAAEGKVKDIRQRRQDARQERIRRANLEQSAVNTGVEGSSGYQGAVGALGTLYAANRGAMAGSALTNSTLSSLNQNAADAMTRAGKAQALSSLSFQFASMIMPKPKGQ